jgi:hypothetical protein
MSCKISASLSTIRSARGCEVHSVTFPHLPGMQPALTNEVLATESQWHNRYTIHTGIAAEHAVLGAKRWQPHHRST